VRPFAMSGKAGALRVDGAAVAQGASATVAVAAGSRFTIEVVSPDGTATSVYAFSVVAV